MRRAVLIAAATLGVTSFVPKNVALPKGRRRSVAPRPHAPRPQLRHMRRDTLLYVAIDDGSSINNGSVTPMIHACLSRQPNRYEAVVALARKAKQRALLDQMGDGNLDGVKPLIAQMDEELEQWEADPAYGEMRDQSWPAKIGVVFVDEDNVDTKVAAEAQKFPGEG